MDKISRSDLLKSGALGLTFLTVSGCLPQRREAKSDEESFDPALLKYREAPRTPTKYHWARDVAVHEGDVWVAGDTSVRCIRKGGATIKFDGYRDATQAVATAADGAVFVATSDAVFPLRGKPWKSLGPKARIVSLVATETEVVAADAGNRTLVRYDRKGRVIQQLDGFIVPSAYFGLAAHGDDLLVSNPGRHRIERYRDGAMVAAIGDSGQDMARFCGCCNPTHLASLPNGDLVASEKGIPRVKVLSPKGELKAVVAPPSAFTPHTVGLSLAVDGERILVLDPWEGAVRAFEPI